MQIQILKSKIHRIRVTDSNLNYEGSLTLPEEILDAAGLLPYEKVQVLNLSTGTRIETYLIKGPRNSGTVSLNGPAARSGQIGDEIIVVSYGMMPQEEAKKFTPSLVYPDENNHLP